MKFKVGDNIRIRDDSAYNGQSRFTGKIQNIGASEWIHVPFVVEYSNEYLTCDLELVEPTLQDFDKNPEKYIDCVDLDGDRLPGLIERILKELNIKDQVLVKVSGERTNKVQTSITLNFEELDD